MDPVNLSGSVGPEDLAWQAAGGADENERLKAQIRQLRQQLADVPTLAERPRVASWTYQGLAVLLVAVVWLLFFSGYGLWDELHLDLSNKLIVDFGAEVIWKIAELFLIPLVLAVVGAVKVALGRDRAGGLRGWF